MASKDMLQFGVKTTGTAAAQTQIKGLASSFILAQGAVQIFQKALQTAQKWVAESLKSYRSFEKKIREVSTILSGEATNAIHGLEAGIENLSKIYGKSADDLAEGTYQILSAAFDASEAINLLTTATKASIAGLTDVATSVDVFTSILNSYGKTVYQAGEISDQLFQTVVRGKLRFEDLASAMGYITPIASNVGVEFKEIAAALSTVTRMGLHVDMATRGLALALQNISNPTKQASDAARKYGIDMSGLALQVNGLEGFITDLNEAMQTNGSIVVSELIRNMRSLRVIMALAGDEGVAGFTKDLDLLNKSAGRTEEALSKMMSSAQMEVDIVAQSFEYLNRRVGEAWQGFDIWWKKSQVWWGTLFSGGGIGGAGDSVKEIEDRIKNIKTTYIQTMSETVKYSRKTSLYDLITDEKNASKLIKENVDFKSVKKYFKNLDEIEKLGEREQALSLGKTELETILSGKKYVAPASLGEKNYKRVAEIAKLAGYNIEEFTGQTIYASDVLSDFDKEINTLSNDSETLSSNNEKLSKATNYYMSAFNEASQEINEHKTNIVSLTKAIKDLKYNVEDTYTSLGGQTHTGKLGYEIDVKKASTELSRSQEFTNMAMKYGKKYINEYNDELRDSILTVYNYTSAQKQLSQTLEEQNDIIKRNNIKILELQIRGMEKRHGLTRGEEIKMKKYQLENAKARLANMKSQFKAEETVENGGYLAAQNRIQKHYDTMQHNLFMLKDVRDDEIKDMEEDYTYQEGLLKDYREDYEKEYGKLMEATEAYNDLLENISPKVAGYMEDMFEKPIKTMIADIDVAMVKFQKLINMTGADVSFEYKPKTIFSQSTAFGKIFEQFENLTIRMI